MATPTKRQKDLIRQTLEHAVVAVRDIPNSALAGFLPHLEEAKKLLLRDLKLFELNEDGAVRYTAHKYRSALVQISGSLREIRALGPEMATTLTTSGQQAAIAGVTAMETQLASLDAMFTGAMVPVSVDRAAILAKGEGLMLRRYPKSAARYAGAIEKEVRRKLVIGVLRQQTIGEVTNSLFNEIPKVFKKSKFNAHRLVRTEIMASYNTHHHEALIDAHSEDDEIRMRWDGSYDFRRCPVCGDLDGRIVDVDGEFEANWQTARGVAKKSTHRRPPAHPN